jgi:hypothetical protein
MKEKFKKLINDQLDNDAANHHANSMENIWEKLDINQQVAPHASTFWKLLSAILFLLLFIGSILYFYSNQNSTDNRIKKVFVQEDASQLQRLIKDNKEMASNNSLLNKEIDQLKSQLEILASQNNERIIYKDRIINRNDTIYIKTEPITIYKDIVVTDTIYLHEPIAEELIASAETETQDERNYRRNSVQFDLRNQGGNNQSEKENKQKSIISFGLNTN